MHILSEHFQKLRRAFSAATVSASNFAANFLPHVGNKKRRRGTPGAFGGVAKRNRKKKA